MIDALRDLNYNHLFYFWSVARSGSMTAACEQLRVSTPTASTQIRKLERHLGHRLFDRVGRGLELTSVGRIAFDYAEDIFTLGHDLVTAVNGGSDGPGAKLVVGIPNVMPKILSYRLLEPVLSLPNRVQLVCREGNLSDLLADLAAHRYDIVLSDVPAEPTAQVKSFNHSLGECPVAFYGAEILSRRFKDRFPGSLDGAPLLLPMPHTDLRCGLDRWFSEQGITPRVVAEFDDGALMKEFGQAGLGLFPAPAAIADDVCRQFNVTHVGSIDDIVSRFYVITTERKLRNPAVQQLWDSARINLLATATS